MGAPTITAAEAIQRLAIALCIGMFIGLEREYSRAHGRKMRAAGFRTHALIGLFGACSAMVAQYAAAAFVTVAFALLAALIIATYVVTWQEQETGGIGITSEVAVLLTFVLGVLVWYGFVREAVVAAGATSVILSAKKPLHRFVDALSVEDWLATMKFAVVTLIVLPVLPNQSYGPYGAFNPFKIWLLVVLIGGISFLGYALTKLIGAERGIPITGLIGGLASSTAVTLSSARRSRTDPELAGPLALATILACSVMIPRLALIIAAVHAPLLRVVAAPFLAMLAVPGVYCAIVYWRQRSQSPAAPTPTEHSNPFELGEALKFAAVFAAIMFVIRWVDAHGGGARGVYAVSAISGLVDTDAIVLSLAQQIKGTTSSITMIEAARGIVVAMVSNSIWKAVLACSLGTWRMGRAVLAVMAATAVVGIVVVILFV